MISRIVLAESVLYIEEIHHHDAERGAVFKLSDLAQLYTTRMEQARYEAACNKVQTTFVS